MSEIPYGCKKCDECNGKGVAVYSCCTGEPVTGIWEDIMMCPKCREHLGEDTCEACEGAGYVVDQQAANYFTELAKAERELKDPAQFEMMCEMITQSKKHRP